MGFPAKEPALNPDQAAEVVARHNAGESIPDLARTFGVKATAVQYQVKKAGGVKPALAAPATTDPLAAVMADPTMQALIAQAVADRLTSMGATAEPVAVGETDKFAGMMSRMFETLSMQQPGYKKPIPPDEMERRLGGKVEMEALLRKFAADNTPPEWRVGEKGFFECSNAIELHEGDEFATYLAPVEDFKPLNDQAKQVHAAMMVWIGGPTPDIGETVRQAEEESKRPLIMPDALQPTARTGPITVLKRAAESTEPAPRKRQLGTIVDEPREVAGGRSADPVGPSFATA